MKRVCQSVAGMGGIVGVGDAAQSVDLGEMAAVGHVHQDDDPAAKLEDGTGDGLGSVEVGQGHAAAVVGGRQGYDDGRHG